MANTLKRMMALLLLIGLQLGTAGSALASQQAQREFKVNITWVNALSAKGLVYDYSFVEKETLETHTLHIDFAQHAIPGPDARILKAQAAIRLPVRNSQREPAVYLMAEDGLGFVELEGVRYTISTAESEDPRAGIPYFSRSRVLTRQMAPMLQVDFQGVQPQAFYLTLHMQSWALNSQGTGKAQHSATRRVEGTEGGLVDLLHLFGGPEDTAQFRYFTLAELAWDGSRIAGTNTFTLEVVEVPGLVSQLTGNAEEGYRILFSAAP